MVGIKSISEMFSRTRAGWNRSGALTMKGTRAAHSKKMLLEPHAALAHHFAVVRGEDDDGVLGLPGVPKDIHDLADLVVDIRDHPVVAVARHAAMIVVHRELVPSLAVMQVAAEVVHLVQLQRRHRRAFDVVVGRSVSQYSCPMTNGECGLVKEMVSWNGRSSAFRAKS